MPNSTRILIVIGSRHQRKQLLIEKKSFDDLSDNLSTYLIETTRANVTKEEMFPWSMIYKKSSHSSSWPYPAITRSGVAITQLSRSNNFPGLPQEKFAHAIFDRFAGTTLILKSYAHKMQLPKKIER